MKSARRSLVQQGSSTLMVSLPANWIKVNNLKKGSEVDISSLNKDLLISAKKEDYKSETAITLTGNTESSVRTTMTNTYRLGYDRIRVNYSDKAQFSILENVVKMKLIGFEIVLKEKDYCVVENITEPSEEQFDNIMNKILFNIDEIFNITSERLSGKEPAENYESVEERIQKYDNFCKRIVIKHKYNDDKSELFWTFLTIMLHGQRELYHLNKRLPNDYKASPEIKHLLEKSREIFNLIKKAYLEKNSKYLTISDSMEKELIYNKGYELLQQKKGKDAIALYHVLVSIREFYQVNTSLLGIIL